MKTILMVNGANINLLGKAQNSVYGSTTLLQLEDSMVNFAKNHDVELVPFQSNHEGAIVDFIHEYMYIADGIIINPGAYTHYSYAISDALLRVGKPLIEVHISNIYKREEFRHKSVIAPVANGQIAGLGLKGYELALLGLLEIINDQDK